MDQTDLALRPRSLDAGTAISNDSPTTRGMDLEQGTPPEVGTPEAPTPETSSTNSQGQLERNTTKENTSTKPSTADLWKDCPLSSPEIDAIFSEDDFMARHSIDHDVQPFITVLQNDRDVTYTERTESSVAYTPMTSARSSYDTGLLNYIELPTDIQADTVNHLTKEASSAATSTESSNKEPQKKQIGAHRSLESSAQSQPLSELQAIDSGHFQRGQVEHPTNLSQSPPSGPSRVCWESKHSEILESVLTTRRLQAVNRVMMAFEEMFGFGEDTSEDEYESWCSERGSFSSASAPENDGSLLLKITELQHGDHNSDCTNSGKGNNQACSTRRALGSAASKQPGKRRKIGGAGGSGPSDDEDEDDSNRNPIPRPSKVPVWETPGKRLACPYSKRNPSETPKHTSCRYPGFTTTSRVKEHLYRAHVLPIMCPRCHARFDTNGEFSIHLTATERCPEAEGKLDCVDGLDQDQIAKLKKKTRAKPDTSEEQKWRSVFQIIFPDVSESAIPSPYVESTPSLDCPASRDSLDFHLYEQLSRRELPVLVRRAVEKEVENETSGAEDRLISRLPEIARICQEQLFVIFRARQGAAAVSVDPASGSIDGPSEPNPVSEGHSIAEHLESVPNRNSIEQMFVEPPPGTETQSAQVQLSDGTLEDDPFKKPRKSDTGDSGYRSVEDGSNRQPPALSHSATQSSQHFDLDSGDLDAGEGPSGYNSNAGVGVHSEELPDFDDPIWQFCLDEDIGFKFPPDGDMFPFTDKLPNHSNGDSTL